MIAPARNAQILGELVDRVRTDARYPLEQFHGLADAHQYLRLYETFRRHVPAGARVLDWGAGNGHFSYFLTRAGYRTTGYSFDGFGFEAWLGDPGYRFVPGNPSDPVRLPFPDASFEAVASVGVLEHVRETGGDEAASLKEIRRVLAPNGTFVCYHFPNRTSAIDWLARRSPGKHYHRYRYGRRDIEALARGAGFELLEVRRYGMLPRNSAHRLLGPMRYSRAAAAAWDAADATLGAVLSPLCQNWLFVARRREEPT